MAEQQLLELAQADPRTRDIARLDTDQRPSVALYP
jgi:hypothetical protein